MTSFFRREMTWQAIKEIHERTEKGTFQIHIYDNGSDMGTQDYLSSVLHDGLITSLTLDSRNTGCLYNKLIFHAMTESDNPYYIVTDNDIYPPKLSPDWLSRMIKIMDEHPKLAMLTPHIPPVRLMEPDPLIENEEIVYCKAVGNALKIIRRDMFPLNKISQKLGAYGDDGVISKYIKDEGYQVAFCKDIFCCHAGQTEDWGYNREEIDKDPRKKGYSKPFILKLDPITYEPIDKNYYWI
jgi:hypothetical protein